MANAKGFIFRLSNAFLIYFETSLNKDSFIVTNFYKNMTKKRQIKLTHYIEAAEQDLKAVKNHLAQVENEKLSHQVHFVGISRQLLYVGSLSEDYNRFASNLYELIEHFALRDNKEYDCQIKDAKEAVAYYEAKICYLQRLYQRSQH